jgi:hypothetical protein
MVWANAMQYPAIVGWEAWIGINVAALANAQVSKFLSPAADNKDAPSVQVV